MKRIIQVLIQLFLFPISMTALFKLFGDFERDTFTITNGLSAIAAATAGLTFTAASVYSESSHQRKNLKTAGMKFFVASLAAAFGTVAKYAFQVSQQWIAENVPKIVWTVPAFLWGSLVGLFFIGGIFACHFGLWDLCSELFEESKS